MSRKTFSPGAWVHVNAHQGVGGQITPPVSAQFMETVKGGEARVHLVNPDYAQGSAFKRSGGRGAILVPFAALSPKW